MQARDHLCSTHIKYWDSSFEPLNKFQDIVTLEQACPFVEEIDGWPS